MRIRQNNQDTQEQKLYNLNEDYNKKVFEVKELQEINSKLKKSNEQLQDAVNKASKEINRLYEQNIDLESQVKQSQTLVKSL